MQDTLRVMRQFPQYWNMIRSVHLVETSPKMRRLQKELIEGTREHGSWDLAWHDSLDEIESVKKGEEGVYTLLNAHEFFDALPVRLIEVCVNRAIRALLNCCVY